MLHQSQGRLHQPVQTLAKLGIRIRRQRLGCDLRQGQVIGLPVEVLHAAED